MNLTEKLNLLMNERNIGKKELSRCAGIPYMTIVNFYEKGTDNIKLSTLIKLKKYFNCTLDYLVDYDNVLPHELDRFDTSATKTENINQNNVYLSEHEIDVLTQYRSHPEMQLAVDTLLGVKKEHELAKNVENSKKIKNAI